MAAKVYGGMHFYNGKQTRCIMAGTQKQVAIAVHASVHYVSEYWAQTGNENEIRTASGAPGILFVEIERGVFSPVDR